MDNAHFFHRQVYLNIQIVLGKKANLKIMLDPENIVVSFFFLGHL